MSVLKAERERRARLIEVAGLQEMDPPFIPVPGRLKHWDRARQVRSVIVHREPDAQGRALDPNGMDDQWWDRAVCWDHDRSLVIAWSVSLERFADRIEAVAQFPRSGVSALSDEIFSQIRQGVIRAASVGASRNPDEDVARGGVSYVRRWRLVEWSFVYRPGQSRARIVSVGAAGAWAA
jgi:hypothetical protein